jgi:hypothetical protein
MVGQLRFALRYEPLDLAQVPYARPHLGLPVHGRPNVFNSPFPKASI